MYYLRTPAQAHLQIGKGPTPQTREGSTVILQISETMICEHVNRRVNCICTVLLCCKCY